MSYPNSDLSIEDWIMVMEKKVKEAPTLFSRTWLSILLELVNLKKRASKSNKKEDWKFYVWYLKAMKPTVEKLYARADGVNWTTFLENILKLIGKELKHATCKL